MTKCGSIDANERASMDQQTGAPSVQPEDFNDFSHAPLPGRDGRVASLGFTFRAASRGDR